MVNRPWRHRVWQDVAPMAGTGITRDRAEQTVETMLDTLGNCTTIVSAPSDGASLASWDVDALVAQLGTRRPQSRHVIVDCAETPQIGARLLGSLVAIWHHVQRQGGQMVLCNVSPLGAQAVRLSRLDTLWQLAESREDAWVRLQRGE